MYGLLSELWSDDSGQGLTEYVLIIAIVSIGLIAVMGVFRTELENVFNNIVGELQQYPNTSGT